MLNLIPKHTYDTQQLWTLIRKRNKWLIDLRYFAFLALVIFLFVSRSFFLLEFSPYQFNALLILSFVLVGYNIILFFISRTNFVKDDSAKFNPMMISLIQIQLDLLILSLLVYFSGGIESPLYFFYVFHMIIGSMILPGYIIYTIAGVIVVSFFTLSLSEYFGLITHYGINGLLNSPVYNNLDYVIIFSSAFGVMVIASVFFANSIASALYRREQELKITLDKLNEAEKVKQKYTMGIVHEIKSPIAAVQSYLDLILGKFTGPISDTVEDKLKKARNRSDEAIQIINDILQISKLKLIGQVNNEKVNIIKILENNFSKRKVQAKNKNIKIDLIDRTNGNCNTSGDKDLLDMAFSNLLGNAVKYTTPEGRIEISIDKEGEEIYIEICDNGIGIPEKDKDKIFGEFYRASNVRKDYQEGTGTGLTVVKQIILQHGGAVTFTSPSRLAEENRQGTSFLIRLKNYTEINNIS